MSITRLQQARQMYALGQRVGFRGGGMDMGNASNQAQSASMGGGGGGGAGGGGGGGNKVDPGFQNALRAQSIRDKTIENQNNKDYGQFFGTRVPTYQPLTFGQKLGQGVGNYIKGGGMIGMVARGLGSLFSELTGPKPTEYGNLNTPGYNMLNIAGPVKYNFEPERGNDGDNQQLYATTNQYTAPTFIEEEGIETLINNPDFVQRFRVKNPYRQDKQGQLDPQIMEMISKLYT
tara:strand:+ start:209 stop:907 length:699 start_codon:yes stop_codon:yes gene_type:complete